KTNEDFTTLQVAQAERPRKKETSVRTRILDLSMGSSRLALAAIWTAVLLISIAFGYSQQRPATGQPGGTGPPLRIDFSGTRSMPAAQPTPAITANTAGPPLRVDFSGSRSMPPVQPVPATAANSAGPALRIDFSGARALP